MKLTYVSMCVFRYSEEEKWYRARVKSIEESTAEVFFLDWGNSESMSTSQLRPLDEQFLSLPAQCILCSLHNVQPITDDWSDEAVAFFEEKVDDVEHLMCRSLLYNEDNVCEVELIVAGSSSVGDHLKKQGLAIEIVEAEEEDTEEFITSIPSDSLKADAKIKVCITHVETPDDFWVQVRCLSYYCEMNFITF